MKMKLGDLKQGENVNLIVEVVYVGNERQIKTKEGEVLGEVITLRIQDGTAKANLDCFRGNFLVAKGLRVGQYIRLINCYCKKMSSHEKFEGWDITTGKKGMIEVL